MKNRSIKKSAIILVKKGINHMDINHSKPIKESRTYARTTMKNNFLTERELYLLLRNNVRKGVSPKWVGSKKWHRECNKILPLLKNL